MKLYRRKDATGPAIQWTGDNLAEVEAFVAMGSLDTHNSMMVGPIVYIPGWSKGSSRPAFQGNWITKSEAGIGIWPEREFGEEFKAEENT
jgi:hypothetical protein